MPKVSFIMSNYNTPVDQLELALSSVINQTFDDYDIIIVNDGSTDQSADLLRDYAKRFDKIKLIENEKNLGLARSLNRALDACTSEYAARMDTDDYCLPFRLEKQVKFMDAHPDVLFSGAWAEHFTDDISRNTGYFHPVMCGYEEYRIRLMFAGDPLMVHPTVIFRMDKLNNYGLRYPEDEKYRYTEDYYMWVQCAGYGKAGILEQSLLKYRNAVDSSRITIRHEKEMAVCRRNVQQLQLYALGLVLSDEMAPLHDHMLTGRKPFDIRYKKWINKICVANDQKKIYNSMVLKKVFRSFWYKTVYYAAAGESSPVKRAKLLFTLPPADIMKAILHIKPKTTSGSAR